MRKTTKKAANLNGFNQSKLTTDQQKKLKGGNGNPLPNPDNNNIIVTDVIDL